jgi:hypothetical protein
LLAGRQPKKKSKKTHPKTYTKKSKKPTKNQKQPNNDQYALSTWSICIKTKKQKQKQKQKKMASLRSICINFQEMTSLRSICIKEKTQKNGGWLVSSLCKRIIK